MELLLLPWHRRFCLQAAVVLNLLPSYIKRAPEGRLFYSSSLSWLALLTLLYSWLAPVHYLPWTVFENEFFSFLSLVLATLALGVKGNIQIKNSKYYFISLFVISIILVQLAIGMISGQVAAIGCLYVFGFAFATLAGANYRLWLDASGPQLQTCLLISVLSAILLSACIVVAQWAGVEQEFPSWMAMSDGVRAFGNIGQPNNQATLLLTGVILVDLLHARRILTIVSGVFFLMILSSGIAMTGSRTAVLAAFVAGIYLLVHHRNIRERSFTALWALLVPLAYLTIPLLKGSFVHVHGIGNARGLENLSESPRIAIYTQLIKAIGEAPFLGFGWMQTALAQSVSAGENHAGYETNYSHNLVFDFVLWFGIPLASLLVYLLVYAVLKDYKASVKKARASFAIIIPFVLHSLLEFPFAYAFFLLPFAFFLGYIHPNTEVHTDVSTINRTVGKLIFYIVFLGGVVIGFLVTIDYMKLAEDFRVLRFNSKNIGKIPSGFVMTDPLLLADMRSAFDVFVYKPRPDVDNEMIGKIKYAALNEHWPSAHVKLISQLILMNDFVGAKHEYMRFDNLYSPGVVNWGVSGLQDAYCQAPSIKPQIDDICTLFKNN